MRKSYDDLVIFQQKRGFISSFILFLQETFFLKPLSWVIHWPMWQNFRVNNFNAAKAYLLYLDNHHRFPDLIHFLIILITESTLDKDQIWSLCKIGAHSVQVRQLSPDVIILTKVEALIGLIPDRLAVQVSYDCSYTLICLSLWRFQRGQMEMALKLAALAAQADPTWGYPDYLLGWYGCFTLEFDPTPHFLEAIHKDWRYTKRILNDKIILNQTEIIKQIKHKLLISNSKKPKISVGHK
jgi:hypothetical protein